MVERIQEFFNRVGSNPKALEDLMRYKAEDRSKFAVIKVSGKCLEGGYLDQLVDDLAFLDSHNLSPLVVLGGGKQYDEAVKGSKKVNGLRVTDCDTLCDVLVVSEANLTSFVDRLRVKGVNAYALWRVLDAEKHPAVKSSETGLDVDLGYVGEVTGVKFHQIAESVEEKGGIPVMRSIGWSGSEGQLYNINADSAAVALAIHGGINKLVMVSDSAVTDANGKVIKEINLRRQYDKLINDGIVTGGMKLKLEQVYKLLEQMGEHYSIQITTPKNMLYELFGPGIDTQVVLGYMINHETLTNENYGSVKQIVETGFGRKLKDNYNPVDSGQQLFYEQKGRGIATVIPNAAIDPESGGDVAYMDKLAAIEKSNGLGKNLLRDVQDEYPDLFWKSNPDNPFNKVYSENSKGNIDIEVEGRPFKLYWTFDAKHNLGLLKNVIQYVEHSPLSFAD